MTDEELAGQPGALATRAEGGEADGVVAEPVFTPKDFRLNLGARLAGADEEPLPVVAARLGVADEGPLPNLDSPSIRKLTWEHVVPDRPASSAPSAATTVPLPPPRRVPPPPPLPVTTFQPPAPVATPEPTVVLHQAAIEDHVEEFLEEEVVDEIVVDDEEIYEEDADDAMELEIGDDVYEEIDDDVDLVEPVDVVEVAPQPPVAYVQPEVNRLALVPDLIEDDETPVELPPITPSGPMVVHEQSVYTPVLAETLYIPPPARVAATMMPAAAVAPGKKKEGPQAGRKQKRHLFRTFMTLGAAVRPVGRWRVCGQEVPAAPG